MPEKHNSLHLPNSANSRNQSSMDKLDKLFDLQESLNQRIGVSVGEMSNEEKTKSEFEVRVEPKLGILKKEPKLEIPEIGSVWKHHNGEFYVVINLANLYSTYQYKYPLTIVYQGLKNKRVWSRPFSDWHRSMTLQQPKPYTDTTDDSEIATTFEV